MSEPGHVPSFRAPGLPAGYADCLQCGQRITEEQLICGACPGRSTTTTDERRPT